MTSADNLLAIIDELAHDATLIDGAQLDQLSDLILDADRVFVAGAGRSGFAARAFANRLMHIGRTVFFVGEPTTPALQRDDVLIIGSGSGETASLVSMARKARELGARVATLTIFPENTIGALSEVVVVIPGVTSKVDSANEKASSIQTPGSSFEQLSWLIYDAIVIALRQRLYLSDADLYGRHANLE